MTTALQALAGLALVLLVARALRGVLDRARQPPVMAEVLAGLVLGASLLGQLPGDPSARLFDDGARELLAVVGQAALALYLLAVGARMDPAAARREGRAVLLVALAAFLVPFAAGAGLALALHDGGPPRPAFVLFLGTALAVTAFPVLARIVDARGLAGRRSGRVALAAAAAQELLVWPLLALAVSLAGAGGDPARLAVLGAAAIAGAVLLARVTPARLLPAGVLLAAALTELAGLHLVLGAFLFGAALPPARRRAALAPGRVRATALALTLPAAFAVPALRVDVWALGAAGLGLLAVVVGVAVAAKLGSAALAAAAAGLSRREALELGVLMNARGLVELVVLSVGVQAGLLGDHLFTVMVLMALVTTFAAGPLVTPRAPRASGGGAWRARPRAGTPPPPSSPAARSA